MKKEQGGGVGGCSDKQGCEDEGTRYIGGEDSGDFCCAE